MMTNNDNDQQNRTAQQDIWAGFFSYSRNLIPFELYLSNWNEKKKTFNLKLNQSLGASRTNENSGSKGEE